MQTRKNEISVSDYLQQTFRDNGLYLLIFVVLILLPYLIGWATDSSPYGVLRGERVIPRGASTFWQSIFIELFVLAILAMSYNLIFGYTGVVSFGHALFFGVGGYAMAISLEQLELLLFAPSDWLAGTGSLTGLPTIPIEIKLIIGVVFGLLLSGVLSFLIGLVSLRIRGVYFAIFTLAIAEMFFIYFGRFPATKADDGFALQQIPAFLDSTSNRIGVYYIALGLFVLTFLFIRRLMASPTGAIFLGIRENEERAKAIGYHTLRYKLLAITLAGTLASIAGMLHVLLNKKVGPEILSVEFTLDPLLMSIIGGVGTLSGPALGATVLHLSDRIFRDYELVIGSWTMDVGASWDLILGISFILVVLVLPQGIVGTWKRWRSKT
jgi:branched-chain amino acid transport system permease protein